MSTIQYTDVLGVSRYINANLIASSSLILRTYGFPREHQSSATSRHRLAPAQFRSSHCLPICLAASKGCRHQNQGVLLCELSTTDVDVVSAKSYSYGRVLWNHFVLERCLQVCLPTRRKLLKRVIVWCVSHLLPTFGMAHCRLALRISIQSSIAR